LISINLFLHPLIFSFHIRLIVIALTPYIINISSPQPIQVPDKCQAFFSIAMETEIGDGTITLFWRDRWLHGHQVEDLALRLIAAIPKRRANKCTVLEALMDHKWISDIRGALTVGVLMDYLHLWNALADVELCPRVADSHSWRFATNGQYSAKLAYESFFKGPIGF
jgi:hypothetical protein